MSYTPDKWTIVDYSEQYPSEHPLKERYAILAGWGGSYVYGASWKRSSSIVSVEEKEDCWNVTTYSGSSYELRKSGYGVTGQTASLLADAQLETLEEESVVDLFNSFKDSV